MSSSPVLGDVSGDGVYDVVLGDQQGKLVVLDGQTGEIFKTHDFQSPIDASPLLLDIKGNNTLDVLVITRKGTLSLYTPRTDKVYWNIQLNGRVTLSPSFYLNKESQVRVIVSDENTYIYCLQPGTEKPLWAFKLGIPILTVPALYDFNKDGTPDISVGCSDGKVYVIDGKGKGVLHKFNASSSRISGKPSIGHLPNESDPVFFVGSEDQKLYTFKADSIDPLRTPYKTNGPVVFAPSLPGDIHKVADIVAYPSQDKNIYLLKAMTGQIMTVIPFNTSPSMSPVWLDLNKDGNEEMVVGTESGSVFSIDIKSFLSTKLVQLDDSILSVLSGDMRNNSKLGLVVSTPHMVSYFETDIPVKQSSLILGILHGGPRMTGQKDVAYFEQMQRKMVLHQEEIDSIFSKAENFIQNKQYAEGESLLRELLILNPQNAEAKKELRNIDLRRNKPLFLKIILILGLVLIAGAGIFLKSRTRKSKQETILSALNSEPLEKVLSKYGDFIKKNKDSFGLALAQAYAKAGILNSDAMDCYEAALKSNLVPEKISLIHYQLARAYIQNNVSSPDSLSVFEAAVKFNKNDSEVLRAYCIALQNKGEYQSSISPLESLSKIQPSDKEVILLLSKGYLKSGHKDKKSVELYLNCFFENPNNKEYVLSLAEFFIQNDSHDTQTGPVYLKAISYKPEDTFIQKAAANYLLSIKDYQQALHFLENTQWEEQNDSQGLYLLGWSLWGSGFPERAQEVLSKATALEPANLSIMKYLGLSRVDTGDSSEETLKLLIHALQHDTQSKELYESLVKLHISRQELDEALTSLSNLEALSTEDPGKALSYYRKLAEIFPDNPKILQGLFNKLIQTGALNDAFNILNYLESSYANDPSKLLTLYNDYLKADRNSKSVLTRRGKHFVFLEKYEEALIDLEKVINLEPDNHEILDILDKIYSTKVKLDPNNLSVLFKLGMVLYQLGDYERAIEYFQKTYRDKYRETESSKYLGVSFMEKGMLDLSYRHLSLLEMDNEIKELLYSLSQKYIEINQLNKALVIMEHIYAEDVNFRDLKEMITRLREQTISVGHETLSGKGFDSFNNETLMGKDLSETTPGKIRYEILQEIGRGNMGIVCLAKDTDLDEMVALKFLPQELRYDTMIIERFKQEVRSTRRLSHPHIVRIYDMGEEAGRRFISMEYINGRNLKDILFEKTKLNAIETIDISIQVASALAYAHKMKVVHRDIKPANIMVTDEGHVKVMDFGIASMMERAGLTQTGALIGTPLYMSPEQAEGKSVDGRSDIYSLGIMMYEFISGHPPFYSGNISYQHVHVEPPPLEEAGVPICLIDVIMKCLKKIKEDRYQNAEECIKELEGCREKITH